MVAMLFEASWLGYDDFDADGNISQILAVIRL
jgi:hypothetical protein